MNAIAAFFDKYNAVACSPKTGLPDYKTAPSSRLVSLLDQLERSYRMADEVGRFHLRADAADVWFELTVRFNVVQDCDQMHPDRVAWRQAWASAKGCGIDAHIRCVEALKEADRRRAAN